MKCHCGFPLDKHGDCFACWEVMCSICEMYYEIKSKYGIICVEENKSKQINKLLNSTIE